MNETPFNAEVINDQHRWKQSLDERSVRILEELAGELRLAWAADSETPKSYPFATDESFWRSRLRVVNKAPVRRKPGRLPQIPPPPKRFADLFEEKAIKAVYENQYSDSYKQAIKLVASGERGAPKALHKLLKAAEFSFLFGVYGDSFMPVPKVQFLHRQLLDTATLLRLDALTNKGLEEFFEDVCPCGKKHNAETIRKLRKRKAR